MSAGVESTGKQEEETDASDQRSPFDGLNNALKARSAPTPLVTSVEKVPASNVTAASSGDRKLVNPTQCPGQCAPHATPKATYAESAQGMDTLENGQPNCTANDSQEWPVAGRSSLPAWIKETKSAGWTAPCSSQTLSTRNMKVEPSPATQEHDWLVCGESLGQLPQERQDPVHQAELPATPASLLHGQSGKSSDSSAQAMQTSDLSTHGAMEEQPSPYTLTESSPIPRHREHQQAEDHDTWEECNSSKLVAANRARKLLMDIKQPMDPRPSRTERAFGLKTMIEGGSLVLQFYKESHVVQDSVMRDVFAIRTILKSYLDAYREDLENWSQGDNCPPCLNKLTRFLEDASTLIHRTEPWMILMALQKSFFEKVQTTVLPHMRDALSLAMTLSTDIQQVIEYGLLQSGVREVGMGSEGSDPALPSYNPFKGTIAYQVLEDFWLPAVRLREACWQLINLAAQQNAVYECLELQRAWAQGRRPTTASCRTNVMVWEWQRHNVRNDQNLPVGDNMDECSSMSSWLDIQSESSTEGKVAEAVAKWGQETLAQTEAPATEDPLTLFRRQANLLEKSYLGKYMSNPDILTKLETIAAPLRHNPWWGTLNAITALEPGHPWTEEFALMMDDAMKELYARVGMSETPLEENTDLRLRQIPAHERELVMHGVDWALDAQWPSRDEAITTSIARLEARRQALVEVAATPPQVSTSQLQEAMGAQHPSFSPSTVYEHRWLVKDDKGQVLWPGRAVSESTRKALRLPLPILRMLIEQVSKLPSGFNKELILKKWGDEIRSRSASLMMTTMLAHQAKGKQSFSAKGPLTTVELANVFDMGWPYICPSVGCACSFKKNDTQNCLLCNKEVAPIHKDFMEVQQVGDRESRLGEKTLWLRKPNQSWSKTGEKECDGPPPGAIPMDDLFTTPSTPAVPLEVLREQGLLQATDIEGAVRVDESGKELRPGESGYIFHPHLTPAKDIRDSLAILHADLSQQHPIKGVDAIPIKEVGPGQLAAHGPAIIRGILGIRLSLLDMMKHWLLLMNHTHRRVASGMTGKQLLATQYELADPALHTQISKWIQAKTGPAKIQDWIARLQRMFHEVTRQTLTVLPEALHIECMTSDARTLQAWKHTELKGKLISLFTALGEARSLMEDAQMGPLCRCLPVTADVWELACMVPRREILQCTTEPVVHRVCQTGVELWDLLRDPTGPSAEGQRRATCTFQDLHGGVHRWFPDTHVEHSGGKITYSSKEGLLKGEVRTSLKDYNAMMAKKRKLPTPKDPPPAGASGTDTGGGSPKAKARASEEPPPVISTPQDVEKLQQRDDQNPLDALLERNQDASMGQSSSSESPDWNASDKESVGDSDVEEAVQLEAMMEGMEDARKELAKRGIEVPAEQILDSTLPKRYRTENQPTSQFQESLQTCMDRLQQMSGGDNKTIQEAVMSRARSDPRVAEFFEKAEQEKQRRQEIAAKIQEKRKEWQPKEMKPVQWSKEMIEALQSLYDSANCKHGHDDAETAYETWMGEGAEKNYTGRIRDEALKVLNRTKAWMEAAASGEEPDWVPYWNDSFLKGKFPADESGKQPPDNTARVTILNNMVKMFKGKSACLPWQWKWVEAPADSPKALRNRKLLDELDYLFPGLRSAGAITEFRSKMETAKYLHNAINLREKKAWIKRGNKASDWWPRWTLDAPKNSEEAASPLIRTCPGDDSGHWELQYTRVDFLWLATIPEMSPAMAFHFMKHLPSMPGGSRGSQSRTNHRQRRSEELQSRMAKAKDWATHRGLAEPKTAGDFKVLLRVVTREMATMDFIVKNPSWLDDLPDLPGCDCNEDLYRRVDYDHRISIPIELLPDAIIEALHNKQGMAIVFRYYRCPNQTWIYHNGGWEELECGVILPAVSGWDYSRHTGKKKNRWKCKLCQQNWKGDKGFLLEIYDGVCLLSVILDAPPQREYAQWQANRVKLYRKFEPTGALLDAAPRKVVGVAPQRILLRGQASVQLWRLILNGTNAESQSLLDSVRHEVFSEADELRQAHSSLACSSTDGLGSR